MSEPLSIGLAGFGVVGGGLCQLLQENSDIIYRRTGRKMIIRRILMRDISKKRSVTPPEEAELTANPADLIEDNSIDVIVELMGGIDTPKYLINAALEHGKHVVTANKALLAKDGIELLKKAACARRILRYEASVAGAIPVVGALKDSLNGNRIYALTGILNGTSNYILSEMTVGHLDFGVALKQAQDLGFAEADPSLDIDGDDAAHKLTLLIRLAFGMNFPLAKIPVTGIRDLSALDIAFAGEFGYNIKLIGRVKAMPAVEGADNENQQKLQLAAGVFPALIHHKKLLARVSGPYNAVSVDGNASGPLFFNGQGAGALPTAGAVLSDLVAVARGEEPNNSGFADTNWPMPAILPNDDWVSPYYARLMVEDEPGVLRDISGCLAAEGISVAQMIQKAALGSVGVPLVFMTHATTTKAMNNALNRAQKAGFLKQKPVAFRIFE